MNGNPEVDFFRDQVFADFRNVLNSEMKQLKSAGLGSHVRKAEPLTPEEEEIIWGKGILGDSTSHALLNTMLFQNKINFVL